MPSALSIRQLDGGIALEWCRTPRPRSPGPAFLRHPLSWSAASLVDRSLPFSPWCYANRTPAQGRRLAPLGRGWWLSTPGLAPLPAVAATSALFLDTEIEFLDIVALQQAFATAGHHDAADLQHVTEVGDLQGHVGVLLDEQDSDTALAVDANDDLEDFLHQLRRQPE